MIIIKIKCINVSLALVFLCELELVGGGGGVIFGDTKVCVVICNIWRIIPELCIHIQQNYYLLLLVCMW